MTLFQLSAVFITLVALGGWVNARTLDLPREVAMLLVGLAGALALWAVQRFDPALPTLTMAAHALDRIDFSRTVLGYMLGFLLFAGAMQVDLSEMRRRLFSIAVLATGGVVASILIVGIGFWLVSRALGLAVALPWALVFGALISPTDPIAVLATVKRGHLSKRLRVILEGEALFNDGVGIVAFTALVALATGAGRATPSGALLAVFVEAAGGLLLGLAAGAAVIRLMLLIDDFAVEVSLTIALAMGVYTGAQALHLSGPIGVVGAGLLIGGDGAQKAMSKVTENYLRDFWTLINETLNAVLFLLLGLEMLVVPFRLEQAGLVAAAIALVLAARVCVVAPWGAFLRFARREHGAGATLVWGGLHGALSLALALSVPPGT